MEGQEKNKEGGEVPKIIQRIDYTDPVFNEQTQLWEIKKIDGQGQELDVLTDGDRETLINKKEDLIKQHILSQINKRETPQTRAPGKERRGKLKRGKEGVEYSKDAVIQDLIRRKLDGEEVYNIVRELSEEHNLSPMTVGMYLDEALEQIRDRASERMGDIMESHIRRYEMLYKWFKENGFIKYATKTLKAKEGLMGVGQDTVQGLEINNYFNENPLNGTEYNLTQLDKKQKERMLRLISKTINK